MDPIRDSTGVDVLPWLGGVHTINEVTTGVGVGMSYKEKDTSSSQPGFVDIQGRDYLSNLRATMEG